MRSSLIIFIFCIFIFNTCIGQIEKIVSVDTQTGVHTVINEIPDVNWIETSPHYTTFDSLNSRFTFRGADSNYNWSLYTLDAITGAIIYSPEFPVLSDPSDNVVELQYDSSTGLLYGLHWDDSEQIEYFVSVNPETGEHTIINEIPRLRWISTTPNSTTFDSINGRYIFRGADVNFNWFLFSIDVNTGNVIYEPPFPVLESLNDNLIELQANNSNGLLYGLHWDDSEQKEYLVTVDPELGNFSLVGHIPNLDAIYVAPNFTTMDDINGRYIARGTEPGLSSGLYAIDINNGSVLTNPSFPVLDDPDDNVVELQYDNSHGILYGLHWDADFVLGSSDVENLDKFTVSPNPFTDKTIIKFNEIQSYVHLIVYDATGKMVRSIKEESVDQIVLDRDQLKTGIYYLQLASSNMNIVKKLLIQ